MENRDIIAIVITVVFAVFLVWWGAMLEFVWWGFMLEFPGPVTQPFGIEQLAFIIAVFAEAALAYIVICKCVLKKLWNNDTPLMHEP